MPRRRKNLGLPLKKGFFHSPTFTIRTTRDAWKPRFIEIWRLRDLWKLRRVNSRCCCCCLLVLQPPRKENAISAEKVLQRFSSASSSILAHSSRATHERLLLPVVREERKSHLFICVLLLWWLPSPFPSNGSLSKPNYLLPDPSWAYSCTLTALDGSVPWFSSRIPDATATAMNHYSARITLENCFFAAVDSFLFSSRLCAPSQMWPGMDETPEGMLQHCIIHDNTEMTAAAATPRP